MDYISVKEAAMIWGIDTSNIGKLCRKGKIPGAKIVGRNWLIPKNAPKPLDGRTKTAKENKTETLFRFPLYINFPVESYVPPLSAEEVNLRQGEVDFYNCDFQKAKLLFEELSGNAENIYVRICANFFMCILSAVYDINISWEKYYHSLNLLLAKDFPHKKDMELFIPWLYVITGQFGKIPEKLNSDSAYEYHRTAWYMNAFLSSFNFAGKNAGTINIKCSEPFVTLCRMMERDGYYVEAQGLHLFLFTYNFNTHNKEAMDYHLRRAIELAFEHDLLFEVADAAAYYPEAVSAGLSEYSDSFANRVHKNSKTVAANYSEFAAKIINTNVYERLSKSDYRYVFYAIKGYPNKQIADICGISERTVSKRFVDIYNKLGINSKQELIAKMGAAFGNE